VTHNGATYYLSAFSSEEKAQWIIQIRAGLESNFANTEIIEYKPSKASFDIPDLTHNTYCPKTNVLLNSNNSFCCKCCGKLYALDLGTSRQESISPILQIGYEEMIKICSSCKDSQACLTWLKSLLYIHTSDLHEQTEEVLKKVDRFKASFKLRRNISTRLNMAAQLKDDGQVDEIEFEALRKIDHEYRQDALLEECDRMKLALEALGNDMQSIIAFLRNPNMTISSSRKESGGLHSGIRLYHLVVLRLLEVADSDPDLIDFYWPQVMQVHLLLAKYRTALSMAMVDMLQQGILAIAIRYPYLALKLSWAILATVGDYQEGRITQSQYCASVMLLLQLEVLTYGVCSCLTDIIHASQVLPSHHPSSTGDDSKSYSVLHCLLSPAHHQKQELMIELYTLLRIRRRVHQVNQEEVKNRRLNKSKTTVLSQYESVTDVAIAANAASNNSQSINESEQQIGDTTTANTTVFLQSNSPFTTSVSLFLSGCSDPKSFATDHSSSSSSDSAVPPGKGGGEGARGSHTIWKGLSAQLDFTNRLTDLVDTLRFVDRPLRCDHLKAELLNSFTLPDGTLTLWGLDPTGAAGEPPYRIHKIFIDDVKVFRTKARAPSLILFEVVLDGDTTGSGDLSSLSQGLDTSYHHHSIVPTSSVDSTHPEEDVLATDINHLVEERMHKTVEGMNRERLNSENSETVEAKLLLSKHQSLNKSYSTNDIPSSHSPNSSSHSSSSTPHASFSKTRKLSSGCGYVQPSLLAMTSASPDPYTVSASSGGGDVEHDRISIKNSPRDGTTPLPDEEDDALGLDPFQSEGLPDEDIEVTKKVITSANHLLQSGLITQEEYNQLVQSDFKYRDEAKVTDSEKTKAKLQSYYGEEWTEKKNRLLGLVGVDGAGKGGYDVSEEPPHHEEGGGGGDESVIVEYSNRNRSRARSRSTSVQEEYNSSRLPGTGGGGGGATSSSEGPHLDDSSGDIFITDPDTSRTNNTTTSLTRSQPYTTSTSIREDGWPTRDLRSFIVKSNDDLRQEVACIQLIELCQEIFFDTHLQHMLWLKPYRIVSTGFSAGFVETLPNTLSIDAIKKTPNFISLPKYFESLYGSSAHRLHTARMNYVSSIAAYSLVTYLFTIKDRHNGNILFDSDGHLIHIDFGFLLGIAPGGSFSVETAPFKLTHEMLEIFGGLDSHYFALFVKAFTTGFLALRSKSSAILTAVEVMSQDSTFPCFQGKEVGNILEKLKSRFRNDLSVSETVEYCLDLIIQSYSNLGTKNYDTFQYYTNGIIP
jgi:hypothetical protein